MFANTRAESLSIHAQAVVAAVQIVDPAVMNMGINRELVQSAIARYGTRPMYD